MGKAIENRIYKFDNIKFLCILFVVLGNLVEYRTEQGITFFNSTFLFVCTFVLPLFIFLSGLFTKKQEKESQFNITRFTYLIILGFLMKGLRCVVEYISKHEDIYSGLIGTSRNEWFLFVLAFCFLIAYWVRNVKPYISIPISIVLGCLIGFVNFDTYPLTLNSADFFYLQRLFTFLPFFLAGYYLTPEKVLKFISNNVIRVISIIIFISFFIICFRFGDFIYPLRSLFSGANSYKDCSIPNCSIYHRLFAYLVSTINIIAIISMIPNVKVPILTNMGKNTLCVYFFNSIVFGILVDLGMIGFFESFGDPTWKILLYLLSIVLTLILSIDIFSLPFKWLYMLIKKIHPTILYVGCIAIFIACTIIEYIYKI